MTEPVDGGQADRLAPVPGSEGPTTLERLQREPSTKDADPLDLSEQVQAVNAMVRRWVPAPTAPAGQVPVWGADITRGATMLAARLYRRRNTPGGIEVQGGDGAVYVSRRDPDIGMLLGIGDYAPPRVG